MDTADSVFSAGVHCKISQSEDGRSEYVTRVTALPSPVETRHRRLLSRTRLLCIGIAILFIILKAIVIFLIYEKFSCIKETKDTTPTTDDLFSSLNHTYHRSLENLLDQEFRRYETQTTAGVSRALQEVPTLLAELQTDADKGLSHIHDHLYVLVQETSRKANASIDASFAGMNAIINGLFSDTKEYVDAIVNTSSEVVESKLFEVTERSLLEIDRLVNQTDGKTSGISDRIKATALNKVNGLIQQVASEARFSYYRGTTFVFNLTELLDQLKNSSESSIFTEAQEKFVGSVRMSMRLRMSNKAEPTVYVRLGCTPSPFTNMRWPMERMIEFFILVKQNYHVGHQLFRQIPSCLDPFTNSWEKEPFRYTETLRRLKNGNMLEDGTLRIVLHLRKN